MTSQGREAAKGRGHGSSMDGRHLLSQVPVSEDKLQGSELSTSHNGYRSTGIDGSILSGRGAGKQMEMPS